MVLQNDAADTKLVAEHAQEMSRKKISSALVFSNNAVPIGRLEKFAQSTIQKEIPVYNVSGNLIKGKSNSTILPRCFWSTRKYCYKRIALQHL